MYEMKQIVLYTSEDCPYCTIAEKILKTVLKEYDGLFKYKSIKIGSTNEPKITSLPTILVGQTKIEGLPDKDQIVSVFRAKRLLPWTTTPPERCLMTRFVMPFIPLISTPKRV